MAKKAEFPRLSPSAKMGEWGMALVTERFLKELGWIVGRIPQESDFGIDAHVDLVDSDANVTGRQLALQVKCGASYFRDAKGDLIPYRGDLRHLNFYLNYPIPVILLIVDPESRQIFWQHVTASETEKRGSHWVINVPKSQLLSSVAARHFEKIAGPAKDYLPELEKYWAVNQNFQTCSRVMLLVSREEIEQEDTAPLRALFERILLSASVTRHFEGRICFFVAGYDEDPREIWEIPQARSWLVKAQQEVGGWFYFLDKSGIRVLAFSWSPPVRSGQVVEVEAHKLKEFWELHFSSLNELTDRLGASKEENKRISLAALEALAPGRFLLSSSI